MPNQFGHAITLARMNRAGEARTHLERSLHADPRHPVAHEFLGGLLETEGRIAGAVPHYEEAIRPQPDFGKAHLDLGALPARKGDRARAAEEFRAAPSDPDARIREMAGRGLAAVGVK